MGINIFNWVSDTTTTLGFDLSCKLRMAFLMQFNAACTALTDLKHRPAEIS
ncbi:hypothetical protein SLEP1_g58633 [Rubroshorea leprosula]|uniref:Uncharacterized protein n=1 Tax=Rubroshorea leprosula TaxID=152421 RepID=A0AAV5MQC3_9ROSI|nr:hypothetical protein SLEP1_g58633 [Rubroshorea leprosula]